MKKFILFVVLTLLFSFNGYSQNNEEAEAVIQKAVAQLGGERYLQVKTIFSTGNLTLFRNDTADLPTAFIDVISFPGKERTEFKQTGNRTIQTNSGETGWLFDAETRNIKDQTPKQIEDFKRGQRTSLDNLLRGAWRGQNAKLTYGGRREAGIGQRNEVVKLTYADGFTVEFEFAATDGTPMKAIFTSKDIDGVESKEEERYGQFIDVQGVLVPFVVDRYIAGKQQSRTNYFKIELNKNVPDSVFAKPADVKVLRKDLKL